MSNVGGNLLASATECRHISTKLDTKRAEWIVWCCSHLSNPYELLTQWIGSLRLSGIGALLCFVGVGHSAPRAQDCPSVCPLSGDVLYQAWGCLHWARKGIKIFLLASCSSAPSIGSIGLVIRRKMDATCRSLGFTPATPGNTSSLSAPHKPKPSLSLQGGCKSFRKIMPEKFNCRQNKRQFPLKFPSCLKLYSLFSYFCWR